jgi:hypothetical protein
MAEITSSLSHAKSVAKDVTVLYTLTDFERMGGHDIARNNPVDSFDAARDIWRWFIVYNFLDHDGHDPDVWMKNKDDAGNSTRRTQFVFKWGRLGRHQVRCGAMRDGKPNGYVKYDQQVQELGAILERQMEEAKKAKLVNPHGELTMLWKWAYILFELGKKQAGTLTASQKREHEKRLAEIETRANKLKAFLSQFNEDAIYPFHAVYLAKESMEEKTLRVFVTQPRGKTDRLVIADWTNLEEPKLHGSYDGKFPKWNGRTATEIANLAFKEAIDDWSDDNHYWPGGIRYSIDQTLGNGAKISASGMITTGDTSWTEGLEGVLKKIAMGAALIGLVLTGVGSVYAGAMIVTSMVAGATGSVLSIHHRHSKGEGDLLDDAIDALDIVANVLGVGVRTGKAALALAAEATAERVAWQAGRTMRLKLADKVLDAMFIGETYANGFSGILLDVKFAKRYFAIMNATGDSPEKRASDLLGLLGEAAVQGGLHGVNHKMATNSEKGEFRGLLDRMDEAERTVVDRQPVHDQPDDVHTRPTANHQAQPDPTTNTQTGHADDVHTRPTANHQAQPAPTTRTQTGHADDVHTRPTENHQAQPDPSGGPPKEPNTVVDAPSFPGHTNEGQKEVTVVNKQKSHPSGGAPAKPRGKVIKPFPPNDPNVFKTYKITDSRIVLETHDGYHFTADIDHNGYVTVDIKTRINDQHSPHLGTGGENFDRMFDHFESNGHEVKGWHGMFVEDNYRRIQEVHAKNPNMTADDLVLESVTGRYFWVPWAKGKGLSIIVEDARDVRGGMFPFSVRFEKPKPPGGKS